MPKPLIVIGTSGHAGSVLDAITTGTTYEVIGLLDSFLEIGTSRHGLEVVGGPVDVAGFARRYPGLEIFVAVGDNWGRAKLSEAVQEQVPGLKFAIVVHPASAVSRLAVLGPGTAVLAGAVVGPRCNVRSGAIVNTSSSVDHNCDLGKFASVAPGVHLGGDVKVGDRSSIGIGAVVRHRISIGADTVIGAGSLVLKDFPPSVVAYGAPARVVRPRAADEKYL